MKLCVRLAMTSKSVYGPLSNTKVKDLNLTKYIVILLLIDVVEIDSEEK